MSRVLVKLKNLTFLGCYTRTDMENLVDVMDIFLQILIANANKIRKNKVSKCQVQMSTTLKITLWFSEYYTCGQFLNLSLQKRRDFQMARWRSLFKSDKQTNVFFISLEY
jgi:hypothetical protein